MEYRIHVANSDLNAALECEADRAERDQMPGVAARQRATALALRNTIAHFREFLPDGMMIETTITVRHVPNVHPTVLDSVRIMRESATLSEFESRMAAQEEVNDRAKMYRDLDPRRDPALQEGQDPS